ncbi:hypothetical protein [Candidatus Magnetobacterium casense]|uniref:Uncharacterized protein n=1 Tax=Candidatus Magnetobacterium casense TaxID=1455061 RepID=A0ABS6RW78_9BACT|nr:hypothetical protein [Candidatus Magnetobacterium casensis]MBV6340702.1 hypothetical protein [Candidatus Magnetobacterium casensis]
MAGKGGKGGKLGDKFGDKFGDKEIRDTLIELVQSSEIMMKHLTGHELKDIEILKLGPPTNVENHRPSDVDLVIPNNKDVINILLVQFHGTNVEKMARWMFYNIVEAIGKYGTEVDIKQYLVYYGKEKFDMPVGINEPNLQYHYHVIDVGALEGAQDIDIGKMAQDITLAVLSGDTNGGQSPVLQAILDRFSQDDIMGD